MGQVITTLIILIGSMVLLFGVVIFGSGRFLSEPFTQALPLSRNMTVTEKVIHDGETVCVMDDSDGKRYLLIPYRACLERIGTVMNVTIDNDYALPSVRYTNPD